MQGTLFNLVEVTREEDAAEAAPPGPRRRPRAPPQLNMGICACGATFIRLRRSRRFCDDCRRAQRREVFRKLALARRAARAEAGKEGEDGGDR
jgi:hypothetical protein